MYYDKSKAWKYFVLIKVDWNLKLLLLKPEYDFEKHLGADSLDVVELVMLIEDEFDIEIEDEIVNEITTVQKILDYIQEHTNKS